MLLLAGVALARLLWKTGDDGTLERVQATGELRVGVDASFPPFESLDGEGKVVGFDADLARAVANRLGAEPVFVNVGFDGLYDALLAGRVDAVISGLPYDPRRTQDVIFSEPYFNAGQVLVVRADDESYAGREWLAGQTVAVEWGSLADMEARRLTESARGMQRLPQPTAQDALNALSAGRADAAIADAVSVHQFIGERGRELRIVETLTDEPYVIAVRLKSLQLAEAIDAALRELSQRGLLDELEARWF
jgi:polar amino acid transport system substrate-binding protein